jgi:hypothetical protein
MDRLLQHRSLGLVRIEVGKGRATLRLPRQGTGATTRSNKAMKLTSACPSAWLERSARSPRASARWRSQLIAGVRLTYGGRTESQPTRARTRRAIHSVRTQRLRRPSKANGRCLIPGYGPGHAGRSWADGSSGAHERKSWLSILGTVLHGQGAVEAHVARPTSLLLTDVAFTGRRSHAWQNGRLRAGPRPPGIVCYQGRVDRGYDLASGWICRRLVGSRATMQPNKAMKLTKLSPAPLLVRSAGSCPRRTISDAGTASQLIASVGRTVAKLGRGGR